MSWARLPQAGAPGGSTNKGRSLPRLDALKTSAASPRQARFKGPTRPRSRADSAVQHSLLVQQVTDPVGFFHFRHVPQVCGSTYLKRRLFLHGGGFRTARSNFLMTLSACSRIRRRSLRPQPDGRRWLRRGRGARKHAPRVHGCARKEELAHSAQHLTRTSRTSTTMYRRRDARRTNAGPMIDSTRSASSDRSSAAEAGQLTSTNRRRSRTGTAGEGRRSGARRDADTMDAQIDDRRRQLHCPANLIMTRELARQSGRRAPSKRVHPSLSPEHRSVRRNSEPPGKIRCRPARRCSEVADGI